MKSVQSERRGTASSTNYIAQDLGAMLGVMLSSQLVEFLGYVIMWRVMVIPYAIGLLVLIIFRKTVSRIEQEFATR